MTGTLEEKGTLGEKTYVVYYLYKATEDDALAKYLAPRPPQGLCPCCSLP